MFGNEVSADMPGQGPKSAKLVRGLSLWAAVEPVAYWYREGAAYYKNSQTDIQRFRSHFGSSPVWVFG